VISSYLSFSPPLLTPAIRQSMEWTAQNSAPQSRFLILTANPWWDDPLTEWFPALAERTSLTTVQGYEWTSPVQFAQRVNSYDTVRSCLQSLQVECLTNWSAAQQAPFDYIFIPKLSPSKGLAALENTPLVQALRQSPAYRLVSEQAGALIFKPLAGE
jgi:hypothetical protein